MRITIRFELHTSQASGHCYCLNCMWGELTLERWHFSNLKQIDILDFCNKNDIEIYQSMIGSIKWAVSIGKMDIQITVMTISSFCEQPQIGHLCWLCCKVGYLAKFKDFNIHFQCVLCYTGCIPTKMDTSWTSFGSIKKKKRKKWVCTSTVQCYVNQFIIDTIMLD